MRQTLFYIPDDIAGLPLFGFGWLLVLWLIGAGVTLFFLARKQGWSDEVKSFLPFVGLVAVAIAFVLPLVKVDVPPSQYGLLLWPTAMEQPQGLPIRGYGVFLLIATVSGVLLATWRARKVGLAPDVIFSLAFYMFVGGIVGARLFFIIQYWDGIYVPGSLTQTIGNMVNFVEGGLVVYGSLIGAAVSALWFLLRNKLPVLAIADLVAPSLPLGLAIGRLGCLMNGCCFGGTCEEPWAVTFPPESPPYYEQHRHGEFFGFRIVANEADQPVVASVTDGGPAEEAGLQPGMLVTSIGGRPTATFLDAERWLSQTVDRVQLVAGESQFDFAVAELPPRSLPVHPTQIYSSINALLLCLVTLAWFPYRRRDGEVFALLIASYAVTRFLLEVIRIDEGGFGGTGLTISQNVSAAMLIGVVLLGSYLWRQPQGSFWPVAPSASPNTKTAG